MEVDEPTHELRELIYSRAVDLETWAQSVADALARSLSLPLGVALRLSRSWVERPTYALSGNCPLRTDHLEMLASVPTRQSSSGTLSLRVLEDYAPADVGRRLRAGGVSDAHVMYQRLSETGSVLAVIPLAKSGQRASEQALQRMVLHLVVAFQLRLGATDVPTNDFWEGVLNGRWKLAESFDRDKEHVFSFVRGSPEDALSMREADVVRLAALGLANKEIAYELGLTKATVATHLRNALKRIGITTRLELIELANQLTVEVEPTTLDYVSEVDYGRLEGAIRACEEEISRMLRNASRDDDREGPSHRQLRATLDTLEGLLDKLK